MPMNAGVAIMPSPALKLAFFQNIEDIIPPIIPHTPIILTIGTDFIAFGAREQMPKMVVIFFR